MTAKQIASGAAKAAQTGLIATMILQLACGSAFAIEPWLNEPIIRRSGVDLMNRADHTLHIPVSAVKIASFAASSLSAAATGSGCMGVRFPTWST